MRFKTMQKKQNLATALGIQKNLGITMHFSEIIKLQYEGKLPYIAWYFTGFLNYCCLIIFEKCLVTPSFLFGF